MIEDVAIEEDGIDCVLKSVGAENEESQVLLMCIGCCVRRIHLPLRL